MVISPVMSYVVAKESDYPSPSDKIKLNKAIGRYRLMLRTIAHRYDVGEVKFGLADMLVGRNDAGDYKEALELFNEILDKTPKGYLQAKALVGKAELLINSQEKTEIEEAIKLCDRASNILKELKSDFFSLKTKVVKGELLLKLGDGETSRKAAIKLFDEVLNDKEESNGYFRARAAIDKAEQILYFKVKDVKKVIELCDLAIKFLKQRPDDYFYLKALLIGAEARIRHNIAANRKKAKEFIEKIVKSEFSYTDMIARAKLLLAEISEKKQANKLCSDVLKMDGIDEYIIDKAKTMKEALAKIK